MLLGCQKLTDADKEARKEITTDLDITQKVRAFCPKLSQESGIKATVDGMVPHDITKEEGIQGHMASMKNPGCTLLG
jgi:hypothetical protein